SVTEGKCYQITATGEWTGSNGRTTGPQGICTPEEYSLMGPHPRLSQQDLARLYVGQHPSNALLAKFDGQPWDFLVGSNATFLAPCSAKLSFKIAQNRTGGERGKLQVKITEVTPTWVTANGETSITARMDERDYLLITPQGLTWAYGGRHLRVGLHEGFYPTLINGIYWWPQWEGDITATVGIKDLWPANPAEFNLTSVETTRGDCHVRILAKTPNVIILDFFDGPAGSSAVGCKIKMPPPGTRNNPSAITKTITSPADAQKTTNTPSTITPPRITPSVTRQPSQALKILAAEWGDGGNKKIDITQLIQMLAKDNGLQITANTITLGNPVPGRKILRIQYEFEGKSHADAFGENDAVAIGSAKDIKPSQELKILAAEWGTGNAKIDVTKLIEMRVKNGGLQITANTITLGNPAPGERKTLAIKYEFEGKLLANSFGETDVVAIGAALKTASVPEPDPPANSNVIERPEFLDNAKPLLRSIASVTSMVVETAADGEMLGLTSDIIATVPGESRIRGGMGDVNLVQHNVDNNMRSALSEAVRAVKLRYPIWERGRIELSFGEKFIKHGGSSAGAAFAVLSLAILEGFEIDPKCAITGDISVDWKIRKVGGVSAKVRGAAIDKCSLAVIPDRNEASFADTPLLHGTSVLYNVQTFSAATLQDVVALARKDRDPKLAEAIKLFTDLQAQLAKNEKGTLADPKTKITLNKILELVPNHLSAKYLLATAESKAEKTLSLHGTFLRLDTILLPYLKALATHHPVDRPIDRVMLPAAITVNARKKLNDLRPIANKDLMPLLTDVAALIDAMDQFAEDPNLHPLTNLQTRAGNLEAHFAQLSGDKDLRANLRREGY
ncbi:MAG: hypothetical protein FWD53_09100, partial [Phycisphaerales bacterium]|nr:hypothetical protein [Phycisphaerales bacterium]